jgi:hypothetical protein
MQLFGLAVHQPDAAAVGANQVPSHRRVEVEQALGILLPRDQRAITEDHLGDPLGMIVRYAWAAHEFGNP